MTGRNLEAYLRHNFAMAYHHRLDLKYIDNMPIWERDLFIDMLEEELQKQKQIK